MHWFKDEVPHTNPWWTCSGCWITIGVLSLTLVWLAWLLYVAACNPPL